MNSSRSSIRLAALQKRAAYNRSAARYDVLQKCAASAGWKMLDIVDPDRKGVGALTYAQALDPSNVGALAGIAGGAGLVGSAVNPDKERSITSRALRAAGGVGLVAGGTYLATNDEARRKFRDAVFSLLGKTRVAVSRGLGD